MHLRIVYNNVFGISIINYKWKIYENRFCFCFLLFISTWCIYCIFWFCLVFVCMRENGRDGKSRKGNFSHRIYWNLMQIKSFIIHNQRFSSSSLFVFAKFINRFMGERLYNEQTEKPNKQKMKKFLVGFIKIMHQ